MWKNSKDTYFYGIHFNFFHLESRLFIEFWVTNYTDASQEYVDPNSYSECDWHRSVGYNVLTSDIFPLKKLKIMGNDFFLNIPNSPQIVIQNFYGDMRDSRVKTDLSRFGTCKLYNICRQTYERKKY